MRFIVYSLLHEIIYHNYKKMFFGFVNSFSSIFIKKIISILIKYIIKYNWEIEPVRLIDKYNGDILLKTHNFSYNQQSHKWWKENLLTYRNYIKVKKTHCQILVTKKMKNNLPEFNFNLVFTVLIFFRFFICTISIHMLLTWVFSSTFSNLHGCSSLW